LKLRKIKAERSAAQSYHTHNGTTLRGAAHSNIDPNHFAGKGTRSLKSGSEDDMIPLR
jgi:hypothetical protein